MYRPLTGPSKISKQRPRNKVQNCTSHWLGTTNNRRCSFLSILAEKIPFSEKHGGDESVISFDKKSECLDEQHDTRIKWDSLSQLSLCDSNYPGESRQLTCKPIFLSESGTMETLLHIHSPLHFLDHGFYTLMNLLLTHAGNTDSQKLLPLPIG